jgi:hypothetical protein
MSLHLNNNDVNNNCHRITSNNYDDKELELICQGVFIGLISLFWLIWKTGRKPTRIVYPCQQSALANIGLIFVPSIALFGHRLMAWPRQRITRKHKLWVSVLLILVSILSAGVWAVRSAYKAERSRTYYQSLRSSGPFGKLGPAVLGGGTATYLSVPHALALPSPHRVVSVHDADATSWTFPCTSSGPCNDYYGDESFVDQAIVDQMFVRGMTALTGENTLPDAWRAILPDYQAGEIVAIKVNFNDAIAGGGEVGYEDDDAYVDALPQVVNSIVAGLTAIGIAEDAICVFDASRYITDRFRSRINYPSVRFIDRTGNGSGVAAATFESPDSSASILFTDTAYKGTHRVADILVDADYLINVPIMKRHGGVGISLSLKNHMGSVDDFTTGGHGMHDYIYLNGNAYTSSSNPLVDFNLNANIRDKTVLIIGDALYGGWSSNNTPPERWSSFDDDSPNMLFFGADPVAVDSVMFDYLSREGYVNPKSEDILILGANAGLGVHESWNNDTERKYLTIDYVELGGTGGDGDDDANDSPPDNGGSSGGEGGCYILTSTETHEE